MFLTGGAIAFNGGNLNFRCGSSAGTGVTGTTVEAAASSGTSGDDVYAGGGFCGGWGTGEGEYTGSGVGVVLASATFACGAGGGGGGGAFLLLDATDDTLVGSALV